MAFSILAQLFAVSRQHQRITRSPNAVGFATPALGELQLGPDETSLLATNMRGTFMVTRTSTEHIARYGFSQCPVESESALVVELVRVLAKASETHGWSIRCNSVPAAIDMLRSKGIAPRSLVVSTQLAKQVLNVEDVPEGIAGSVDQMRVLVAGLPADVALLAMEPARAGVCVRVGDSVGVLVRPQALVVVQP